MKKEQILKKIKQADNITDDATKAVAGTSEHNKALKRIVFQEVLHHLLKGERKII